MTPAIQIKILNDTATPFLKAVSEIASKPSVRNAMARECESLTKGHIAALPSNRRGWTSTGFYKAVARNGVTSQPNADGFRVLIDHPEIPGSMRQRYYGGTIKMKDKLLTIPNLPQFYGHKATDFTNLRFVSFGKTGLKALVVAKGGTSRVNFATGKGMNVRGLGKRAVAKAERPPVAYWLKESVDQEGDPNVIPSKEQYADTCKNVLLEAFNELAEKGAS